ncbi:MAG TPA: CaiB/BaiF CoA-transferase family protein [Hyphomicrobiaceae bacterium]|jgi:crotonobetainyl-CoA:carnitine CoA-transferase CaiB-like acyl-CoA transferase|nr:CaiB/BaiF CoA-transferase family protein [Hyphomicrobiaceae bacterium]
MTGAAPRPLSGLKVLDFGHTIMGPCAGLLLADLGADVIKVEAKDGDATRRLPGFAAGFFAAYNRNKRSIAIDLKRPDGQAVLQRLAATADVLVENFAPGTIDRLGCGWADLEKVNPRLIYLSLKGYLAGPYENRGALDEVVQMQTGLAYMTGPPGKPLRMGAPIIDILGAVFGIVAVLAALRERERTGRGQRVGSALFESAAFLVGTHMAGSAVTGRPMPPMPARKGAWGVYDVFNTSDQQQVFIAVTSDGHWQRFCEKFAFVDLGSQERLATNAARSAEREWLIPELAMRLAGLCLRRILEDCEAAQVPCARINRPDDLSTDPHLLAGGALLATALSALGGGPLVGLPALPLEFGDRRERPELSRQPPRIGEHAADVLCEAGFSPAEIQALMASGILGRQTA